MVNEAQDLQAPATWLVEWMRDAVRHEQRHSLVLGATCATNLHRIASSVADYLNEFDSVCGCHWRTFDTDLLHQLAGDPATRNIVLGGSHEDLQHPHARPDLDRIARRLARLGGVILEGQCGADATSDLGETFHVHLSKEGPPPHLSYHMWVNPLRFSPESLVSVIADSFLDWSSHPGVPASALPESPSA